MPIESAESPDERLDLSKFQAGHIAGVMTYAPIRCGFEATGPAIGLWHAQFSWVSWRYASEVAHKLTHE